VFARLIDIGVEPFLVASSVTAVVAQRLVRKVCEACAQTAKATRRCCVGSVWRAASRCAPAAGVPSAADGVSRRTGIFQVLPVDATLRGLVMREMPIAELEQEVGRLGIASLREAALAKVRDGVTTPEEVLRVLGAVDADE